MSYDFANSPTTNQVVTNGGVSYRWDSTKWVATGGSGGVTSFNTRTGAVTLSNTDVTTALAYTPYNATNPSGYQTAAQVTAVVPGTSYADNGGFAINQRTYVSGTALAVGAFGHDRWKGGASGCTYTFTQSGNPATTITITAGTLQQVVEGAAIVGGIYTLSWTGTAQGRVGAGSYAASPVTTGSLTAGANATIEFNAGTLGRIKFEAGSTATPWVAVPPALELQQCQRFYVAMLGSILGWCGVANATVGQRLSFPAAMRSTPAALASGGSSFNCGATITVDQPSPQGVRCFVNGTAIGTAAMDSFNIVASADL